MRPYSSVQISFKVGDCLWFNDVLFLISSCWLLRHFPYILCQSRSLKCHFRLSYYDCVGNNPIRVILLDQLLQYEEKLAPLSSLSRDMVASKCKAFFCTSYFEWKIMFVCITEADTNWQKYIGIALLICKRPQGVLFVASQRELNSWDINKIIQKILK